MSRYAASARLRERLRAGTALLERWPRTWFELWQLTQDYQLWSGENRDLLRALFVGDAARLEYSAFHGRTPTSAESLETRAAQLRDDVATKLARMSAIGTRIRQHRTREDSPDGAPLAAPGPLLLAHGGDDAVVGPITALLGRLGIEPVGGVPLAGPSPERAIGHAIVVLTAGTRERALLDLGYFLGALGRPSVTVLHDESTAMPAELVGVFSLALDPGGAWKLLLARDLRRAGYPVDATGLLAD